jgi:hypothetical protein
MGNGEFLAVRRASNAMAVSRFPLLVASLVIAYALTGCATRSPTPRPSAPAAAPDTSVERYRAATREGSTGDLVGRVYEERRKPDARDRPFADTIVTLVPYSATFRSRLETVKRESRESMNGFRQAVPNIRQVREAYEAALWEQGAGDLILAAPVGADGTFRLDAMPAGHWLLLAWRAEFVERAGLGQTAEEQRVYTKTPRLKGFYRVAVWLREIDVAVRATDSVELTDRGAWFNGIDEQWDRVPPARRRPAPR